MGKNNFFINLLSILIVLFCTCLVAGVIFYAAGLNPLKAYGIMLQGIFGRTSGIAESLVTSIPLLLTGLAALVAFKGNIWNIGAEGQFYLGAAGATFAALNFNLPLPLHLLLMIIFAFIAGAGWAVIAGFLRARMKINEILTTLMLNFIAFWLVHYLTYGPWRDAVRVIAASAFFPETARLPVLFTGLRLHLGFFLGLAGALLIFLLFKHTKIGYAISLLGSNEKAAEYGGINLFKNIMVIMIISGGLAGIAGMTEVAGIHYSLRDSISPGYGYIGIGVALLGNLNSLGLVPASIFFGALFVGASFLKTMTGLHSGSIFFLVGMVIIAMSTRGRVADKLKSYKNSPLLEADAAPISKENTNAGSVKQLSS